MYSLLALLKTQRDGMSLPRIAACLQCLVEQSDAARTARESTILEILRLLSQKAMLHQKTFDVEFCGVGITCLTKLISTRKSLQLQSPGASIQRDFLQSVWGKLSLCVGTTSASNVCSLWLASVLLLPTVQPLESFNSLCERSIQLADILTLQQISDLVVSMSQLQVGAKRGQLLELLCTRLAQVIESEDGADVEVRVIGELLRGVAVMEHGISSELLHAIMSKAALLSRLEAMPHLWKAKYVVDIVWSIARLHASVEDWVMDLLAHHTRRLCQSYTPEDLASTFWAYASIYRDSKVVAEASVVQVLIQRAAQTISSFSPQYLKEVFWSVALLREHLPHTCEMLLTKMYHRAASIGLDELNQEQVSGIMWAIASLHSPSASTVRPVVRDVMERMVTLLPKLARDADAQFLVHTLHAMAMMHIKVCPHHEYDTLSVRARQDLSPDLLRSIQSMNRVKGDMMTAYSQRLGLQSGIATLTKTDLITMLWAIRHLAVDAGGDLMGLLSRHALAMSEVDVHVVLELMWTYGALWCVPEPDIMVQFERNVLEGVKTQASNLKLDDLTRLLWALAAVFSQAAETCASGSGASGFGVWRAVLDEVGVVLLQQQHCITEQHLKHLHQFFLTCNTSMELADMLSDSMLDVKQALEQRCIVHALEVSAALPVPHLLGESCAAQVRKMGFDVNVAVECPNSGYNLDLLITPTPQTPAHLQPPAHVGQRGWVLEIDHPLQYLTGARGAKHGRYMLRCAQLVGIGYGMIALRHVDWLRALDRPDIEIETLLTATLHRAFSASEASVAHSHSQHVAST